MKKGKLTDFDKETIEIIKKRAATIMLGHLIKNFAIYLFGSYAKKTTTKYSDVDIMIVVDRKISNKENFRLTGDLLFALADIGYAFDVIIKSKIDYLEEKAVKGTFVHSITNESIAI